MKQNQTKRVTLFLVFLIQSKLNIESSLIISSGVQT